MFLNSHINSIIVNKKFIVKNSIKPTQVKPIYTNIFDVIFSLSCVSLIFAKNKNKMAKNKLLKSYIISFSNCSKILSNFIVFGCILFIPELP